jgi:hypothetical protein
MSTTADVMIYTPTTLSNEQFDEVARQVSSMDGVVQFQRHERKPNIIMVAYQAGQTRAITILNKVTRLGFNASLVSM